jgi:phosphatidylinositol alpha-mannosyltransferase
MRVALWHTTLPEPGRKPGGVDVGVHSTANALAKTSDDEITVFSLSPCPVDAAYQHVQLFADAQWLRRNKLARYFILPLLLNLVKFKGFDVLHLHGDDWFYLRRTLPTVRTLHGSALREARSAPSLRRKLMQYIGYPLEHCSAKLATVPLAVGKDAARIYRIKDVVDAGVDPRLFCPGSKAPSPCILFVGTWEGRKRGKFLFETFTRYVLPKVPSAKLYMVSDFCLNHPKVINVKYPSDEVLAKLFREAWVFALPSIYEGFGLPVLEALASGTAVVSSPNGGASHILAGGTYGIIADDASFGEHLVELLRDSHKRKALERAGKARSEKFTWAAVAARYRGAYTEAISKG